MKYLMLIPVLCFFIQISANDASPSDGVDDPTGCDKAVHYRVLGDFDSDKVQAHQNYLKAIELCPGYIRPYELVGNLYRKERQSEKAIAYFTKAAELGAYLRPTVSNASRQAQTPLFGRLEGEGEFLFFVKKEK
jgi:tetratricopeptide (TPR) repeat protein